jgi:tetratricopeptide (TPR) repeat protein
MPLRASNDFGAQLFGDATTASIHDHLFLGANTALPFWNNNPTAVAAHQEFLRDCARVDIFGLRQDGTIAGELIAPLRPHLPMLEPGRRYLLEVVIRTLTLGHHLTQGTADSNEIWLEVTLRQNGELVGSSGLLDNQRQVDPWSHFVNVFMLDREGRRIDRRNAQDIFVPLYNHQIPPGAAQTVHYAFDAPAGSTAPIEIEVKLQFRKFDQTYLQIVADRLRSNDVSIGQPPRSEDYRNDLPVSTLSVDRISLPVVGGSEQGSESVNTHELPSWERWNDYGIGLLLKGKAELRQASDAFERVKQFGRYDGPLNQARVLYAEGRLDEATTAIRETSNLKDPPAPAWTLAWLSGLVNREQGRLAEAEQNFRNIVEMRTQEQLDRGFDFSKDYDIINLLGQTIFEQARGLRGPSQQQRKAERLAEAAGWFQKTLVLDPENVAAHYNLQQLFAALGDDEQSDYHRRLHLKYKGDDNARDRAVAAARRRYPAANHAAEAVTVYDLQRVQKKGE